MMKLNKVMPMPSETCLASSHHSVLVNLYFLQSVGRGVEEESETWIKNEHENMRAIMSA